MSALEISVISLIFVLIFSLIFRIDKSITEIKNELM